MIQPTIVVIAFNREKPLSRLLESLDQASYPNSDIRLHISIDGNENENVIDLANNFVWAYGEKTVTINPEHLGLKKHVLQCGDLTEKYETIIVLEDDLIVSKGYYNYALHANNFYSNEPKVAGISLYTYSFEENNFFPFVPLKSKGDVHFMRLASSWGQLWSKKDWFAFKAWLNENPSGNDSILPSYMVEWGSNSWKKLFNTYLIYTNKYFVFPNNSFSSNFEEQGTHAANTGLFQVPLNLGDSILDFCSLNESNSVYDEYYELKPLCLKRLNSKLINFDFDTDLFGSKPLEKLTAKYVVTCKTGREPKVTFGSSMKPIIQNVIFNIEGSELGLYERIKLLPTTTNRFLSLTESHIRQKQLTEIKVRDKEKCSIIIPVKDDQITQLTNTLRTIANEEVSLLSIVFVCSNRIKKDILGISNDLNFRFTILEETSQNQNKMLRTGIHGARTEYCAWIQPGMKIFPQKCKKVAQIFKEIKAVQIIIGSMEESVDSQICLSPYRWTPQRVLLNQAKFKTIRTELVFWRKSLLREELIDQITCGNLVLKLLRVNPIYAVDLKIGDTNNVPQSNYVTEEEISFDLTNYRLSSKLGILKPILPIFERWFTNDKKFLRLFFKELNHLPLVVRYNREHDTFFFSNY